jgi:hypothetical protein
MAQNFIGRSDKNMAVDTISQISQFGDLSDEIAIFQLTKIVTGL